MQQARFLDRENAHAKVSALSTAGQKLYTKALS